MTRLRFLRTALISAQSEAELEAKIAEFFGRAGERELVQRFYAAADGVHAALILFTGDPAPEEVIGPIAYTGDLAATFADLFRVVSRTSRETPPRPFSDSISATLAGALLELVTIAGAIAATLAETYDRERQPRNRTKPVSDTLAATLVGALMEYVVLQGALSATFAEAHDVEKQPRNRAKPVSDTLAASLAGALAEAGALSGALAATLLETFARTRSARGRDKDMGDALSAAVAGAITNEIASVFGGLTATFSEVFSRARQSRNQAKGGPSDTLTATISGSVTREAVALSGELSASFSESFGRQRQPRIPNAPTNLTANWLGPEVVLNWNHDGQNVTGFRIYRNGLAIDMVGSAARLYTHPTTGLSGEYCYFVCAFNANGESPASNVDCVVIF